MKLYPKILTALALPLFAGCLCTTANATLFIYDLTFSSLGEAASSPGTGFGTVDYDDVAHTLDLSCSFSGLLGTTTASHIHAATASPFAGNAGVATTLPSFALFPLGVTSGTFNNVLDLTLASSYNPAFVTANGGTTASAEAALAAAFASGEAYWNIHTTAAPGGEVRGFLVAVPEPGTLGLLGLGLGAAAWLKRKSS